MLIEPQRPIPARLSRHPVNLRGGGHARAGLALAEECGCARDADLVDYSARCIWQPRAGRERAGGCAQLLKLGPVGSNVAKHSTSKRGCRHVDRALLTGPRGRARKTSRRDSRSSSMRYLAALSSLSKLARSSRSSSRSLHSRSTSRFLLPSSTFSSASKCWWWIRATASRTDSK